MYKLKKVGITGLLYSCIESFLTNRIQRVKVGNATSESLSLVSGTPQGSVLGPFLFLLYINDLPYVFIDEFRSKLFADDLKSYNMFDYRVNPDSVQFALDSLVSWSKSWQLQLSVPKCGSVLLKGKSPFEDTNELVIDNNPLAVFESVKDLGVILDNNLSFSLHIDGVVSKAKQRMFLIFKSFVSRDIGLLAFAYKAYILPIVDYCSTIWFPNKLDDIDRVEKIQKSFTKRLHGLKNVSYKDRLIACSLPSLELRCLRTDIVLCFKIVHKFIALDFNDSFTLDVNCRTRGHNFKLNMPKSNTSLRLRFFSDRIVPVWNSLPHALVNCSTVKSFKKGLNIHNSSNFLKRDFDNYNFS